MEEIKQQQIFILCDVLSERFDQQQWSFISSQSADSFLKMQQLILNKLLRQKQLFQKYFQNFYSNHVKLLNWSILAVQNKAQISSYVFRSMVSKGSIYFSQKIKEGLQRKLKNKKSEQKQQINYKQIKCLQQQVYQDFFNIMLNGSNPDKRLNWKSNSIVFDTKSEPIDSHDFYIRTFNACNGWKYIFYNYEKHMKGLNEKYKYNQKIRYSHRKSHIRGKSKDTLGLLDYQHPGFNKNEIKNYKLNQIVSNGKLNSVKGLKQLMKQSRSNKIVFQNHQGRPIAYRITKQ